MDAIDLEIVQIKEYQVFKDYGKVVYEKGKITNAPKEHKKIELILCLMSSIVKNSRQVLWGMDTIPRNQMKLTTKELFH